MKTVNTFLFYMFLIPSFNRGAIYTLVCNRIPLINYRISVGTGSKTIYRIGK